MMSAASPTLSRERRGASRYEAWLDGQFTLLASEPILAEVDAVLRRPEVLRKLQITVLESRALIALLRRRVTLVTPSRRIRRCRDPDDDRFLDCAGHDGNTKPCPRDPRPSGPVIFPVAPACTCM
jgi:putative PIN family toxin of toxin-antitoxin system